MRKVLILLLLSNFVFVFCQPVFAQKEKMQEEQLPNVYVFIRLMTHPTRGSAEYKAVLDQNLVQRNPQSYTNTYCESNDSNISFTFYPALIVYGDNTDTRYMYFDKDFAFYFSFGDIDGKEATPPQDSEKIGIYMTDLDKSRQIIEFDLSALQGWYIINIATKDAYKDYKNPKIETLKCSVKLRERGK